MPLISTLEQSQIRAADDIAFDIKRMKLSVERSKNRRTIDDLRRPAHGTLRVQSEQSAQATIRPGAGTECQKRAIREVSVTRKQRERFKVGLLLLAVRFASGQLAFKKPNQMTGFAGVRAKHTEVKFIVGYDVIERIKARESACGTQMQGPPRSSGRKVELANLGEGDHSCAVAFIGMASP